MSGLKVVGGVLAFCFAIWGGVTLGSALFPDETETSRIQRVDEADFTEYPLQLSDGRTVLCIRVHELNAGMECDWEGAK